MDVSRPYAVISSPLDLEVLLVLRGTNRPLTGRDVARLVRRGSPAGVQKALRRLTGQGVVRAEEAGRALLYTLNRDHLAVPALEVLAGMRAELEARLRSRIAQWKIAPMHVSIFGSAARGDGDTSSDIDLFVVRSETVDEENEELWRAQLEELAADVRSWTGNHLAIAEVGEQELERLRRENPPVAESLRRDAITVTGPTPNELIGGGA
jgi:predicted nucleotidyltransferase